MIYMNLNLFSQKIMIIYSVYCSSNTVFEIEIGKKYYKKKMLYKDRDKIRNDESTIQGTGRIASNHQELEETEGFFRLQREHGHTSALISNLLLPDCERISF